MFCLNCRHRNQSTRRRWRSGLERLSATRRHDGQRVRTALRYCVLVRAQVVRAVTVRVRHCIARVRPWQSASQPLNVLFLDQKYQPWPPWPPSGEYPLRRVSTLKIERTISAPLLRIAEASRGSLVEVVEGAAEWEQPPFTEEGRRVLRGRESVPAQVRGDKPHCIGLRHSRCGHHHLGKQMTRATPMYWRRIPSFHRANGEGCQAMRLQTHAHTAPKL